MKIEIWSDFVCPFCYIGKRKLELALKDFKYKDKVEIVFKSYELNLEAPLNPVGAGYEAFAATKWVSLADAKRMMDPVKDFAAEYGLEYHLEKTKIMKTITAHRLAKWARTFGKELVLTEAFMHAYFTKGANLADQDTLLTLVARVGLDQKEALDVILSDRYLDVVETEIYEARLIGVRGVPFFVFDQKYAIAGAQPDELFVQTIEKAFKESSPFEMVGDPNATCSVDEGCAD